VLYFTASTAKSRCKSHTFSWICGARAAAAAKWWTASERNSHHSRGDLRHVARACPGLLIVLTPTRQQLPHVSRTASWLRFQMHTPFRRPPQRLFIVYRIQLLPPRGKNGLSATMTRSCLTRPFRYDSRYQAARVPTWAFGLGQSDYDAQAGGALEVGTFIVLSRRHPGSEYRRAVAVSVRDTPHRPLGL
jgi:hypothetical protein